MTSRFRRAVEPTTTTTFARVSTRRACDLQSTTSFLACHRPLLRDRSPLLLRQHLSPSPHTSSTVPTAATFAPSSPPAPLATFSRRRGPPPETRENSCPFPRFRSRARGVPSILFVRRHIALSPPRYPCIPLSFSPFASPSWARHSGPIALSDPPSLRRRTFATSSLSVHETSRTPRRPSSPIAIDPSVPPPFSSRAPPARAYL